PARPEPRLRLHLLQPLPSEPPDETSCACHLPRFRFCDMVGVAAIGTRTYPEWHPYIPRGACSMCPEDERRMNVSRTRVATPNSTNERTKTMSQHGTDDGRHLRAVC